jgi:hypothetical protein
MDRAGRELKYLCSRRFFSGALSRHPHSAKINRNKYDRGFARLEKFDDTITNGTSE